MVTYSFQKDVWRAELSEKYSEFTAVHYSDAQTTGLLGTRVVSNGQCGLCDATTASRKSDIVYS